MGGPVVMPVGFVITRSKIEGRRGSDRSIATQRHHAINPGCLNPHRAIVPCFRTFDRLIAPDDRYRCDVAELIDGPSIVEAAGSPPKTIREHVGRVNTATDVVSVAHMSSPPGWTEPWQTPDFDEWTLVLSGSLVVEDDDEEFVAIAGQTVHAPRGRKVRYSTPDGADYVAVCVPAFSPQSVYRAHE